MTRPLPPNSAAVELVLGEVDVGGATPKRQPPDTPSNTASDRDGGVGKRIRHVTRNQRGGGGIRHVTRNQRGGGSIRHATPATSAAAAASAM